MTYNFVLFYDDCHKIYYAEADDQATIDKMTGYGYKIMDGDFEANLRDAWDTSCPLRLVDHADFKEGWPTIEQGHKNRQSVIDKFMVKLRKQIKEVTE